MRSVPFAEAAKVTPTSSHEYRANVHGDYSYGPAANGGFLVCLLWKAVIEHFLTTLAKYGQLDTVSFHVEFLRPVTLGDISMSIKDTRLGRASSTVHAALFQGGKERVAAYFTNINRQTSKSINMPTGFKLDPPIPAINFENVLQNVDGNWFCFRVPYKDPSLNKCLSNILFVFERKAYEDKTIMQCWLGLSNPDEKWTTDKLGIACDMYVPALENFYDSRRNAQGMVNEAMKWAAKGLPPQHTEWDLPRWYTTVNMTVEVKRTLPEEGVKWLFMRMRTNEVIDGRLDVHGQIWDPEGNLIALAQYLWFVVDTSRAVITKDRTREVY